MGAAMNWFSHSGQLGDIIYALPAIRAAGGGILYLYHDRDKPALPMTRQKMDLIRPILVCQPYIEDVVYWSPEEARDHPLNGFRDFCHGRTIADMHLLALGLSATERDRAWLSVQPLTSGPDVLFHRSARYRNPQFPWKRIWERYHARAAFVGHADEYGAFCHEVGPVPRIETSNLLELAQYIAGCRLFIGNQSAPYAIAEGFKKWAILEVSPEYPNCCFPRSGVIHGRDGLLELPDLEALG